MNPVSPSSGHTSSVVPRTAVTSTRVPSGDGPIGAAEREPALAGEQHMPRAVGVAHDVEGHHLFTDERAVDPATELAFVPLMHAAR